MDAIGSIWRSLVQGGNNDLAVGKRLLEAIHAALAQAVARRGVVPLEPEVLLPIRALCDQLLPAHFGLKIPPSEHDRAADDADGHEPATPSPKQDKSVYYQHIYEDETFSMGIFILSPGASIPLHDHPGMSVVSRVLYGSMSVKAYDLVDADAAGTSASRGATPTRSTATRLKARMCTDAVVAAPFTTDLSPDHGNLHEFVAGAERGCAIFDILTPPYDERAGRDCTYYRVVPSTDEREAAPGSSKIGQVLTLEMVPPTLEVHSEPYCGPRLQRYV